ncbi:MAG: hypothetical protein QM820_16060 [Minicystis sp.]
MAGDPKNPEIGEIHIDASVCAPFIVDLPPGGLSGLRVAHDGVDVVVAEIAAHQAAWGDKAGVTAGDFDQIMTSHDRVKLIDRFLPAMRKAVEVMEETRAKEVDARERGISSVAASVDVRARAPGNEVLLAKYEETRGYRSEIALRGAKTRKRNAQEKAAQAANGAPAGDAPANDTPKAGNG